jgi:acetyl esterase
MPGPSVLGGSRGSIQRSEITASTNHAVLDQVRGLPRTPLLVDESAVLLDEREAYTSKFRFAGVPS